MAAAKFAAAVFRHSDQYRELHTAVCQRQPTDSSIHFRYSVLPSSIEITMHSGNS